MATETEKALQELREFLEAEELEYDFAEGTSPVKVLIGAYNKQGDELTKSLDEVDTLQRSIEDTGKEMEVFIGEHDAARSLWKRLQNLCAEFDIPPSQRPSQITLDFVGCERIVDLLAMKVRNGKTPRGGWGN